MLAVLLNVAAFAQGEVPAFCLATDPADPDYDITDFDAQRDADDWCKLAYHQPHKARRQLSKAVALVRTENNPNRYYLEPKRGNGCCSEGGEYIQLLRPWMAEQNAAGTHDWAVFQHQRNNPLHDGGYLYHVEAGIHASIVNRFCEEDGCGLGQRFAVWITHNGGLTGQGLSYGRADITTNNCNVDSSQSLPVSSNDITYVKRIVEGALDNLQAECSIFVPNP